MKALVLVAVAGVLVGCSTSALAQDDRPPSCSSPRQCEIMWQRAQEAVGLLATMRIRLATDNRIETFAPVRGGNVGATATKVPVGPTGYEFRIALECYYRSGCEGIQTSGTKLFNTMLRDVPTAAPSAPAGATPKAMADTVARSEQCNASPDAFSIAKGASFEVFSVGCSSGDVLMVRCEGGSCRALK